MVHVPAALVVHDPATVVVPAGRNATAAAPTGCAASSVTVTAAAREIAARSSSTQRLVGDGEVQERLRQGRGVHRQAGVGVAAGLADQRQVRQARDAGERADLDATDARRVDPDERDHPLAPVDVGACVGQREGRRGAEVVGGARRRAPGQHALHRDLEGDDVGEQAVVQRDQRPAGHGTDVAVQHRDRLGGRVRRGARVEGDRPRQAGGEARRVEPVDVRGP